MTWNYSNNSVQTALTISVSAIVETIVVNSVTGLPVAYPYTLTLDYGQPTAEVVSVISGIGTTLEVVRGEDGTSAQTHTAGAIVAHTVVARDLREAQEHIAASSDVHGIGPTADLVGTDTAQTLTGKIMSGAANTFTAIPGSAVIAEFGATEVTDLTVTDDATVAGDLGVTGNVTAGGTLGVTGTLTAANNATVGGDLTVAGTATVDELAVTGGLEVDGLVVNGEVEVAGGVATVVTTTLTPGFDVRMTGDTYHRLQAQGDGSLNWASGAADTDAYLYRDAAGGVHLGSNVMIDAPGFMVNGIQSDTLIAVRTADLNCVSDNSVNVDPQLQLPVVSGARYTFKGQCIVDKWGAAAAGQGLRLRIGVPGSSTGSWRTSETSTRRLMTGSTDMFTASAVGTVYIANFEGTFVSGGTGIISVDWSAVVNEATPFSLLENSKLELRRLS